jgi:hypothetical protein
MCSIDGCDAKPVAKSLCAKHYMRVKRQGSPDKTGKPGRPRSPRLELTRSVFPDYSARTIARHNKAMQMLGSEALRKNVIQKNTRPNGSISVSGMLATAKFLCSEEFAQNAEIMDQTGYTYDQDLMEFVEGADPC